MLAFDETNSFCISVSGSPRWAKMERRFKELNMRVSRWNAATSCHDRFVEKFSAGEKACAQSHVDVWRHICAENLPYALVMEDDACFDWKWRARLTDFVGMVDGWDLILLNASEPMCPYRWANVVEQYMTGAYILTRLGAERLLAMFRDQFWTADWMTTRFQLAYRTTYSYFPWLVIQDGEDSTLQPDTSADRAKVLRCLGAVPYSLSNYCV